MKKIISLFSLAVVLILSSCSKEDNLNPSNNLDFKNTSKAITSKIKSWSNSKSRVEGRVSNELNSLLNSEYFDFDNSISYIKNNHQEIVMVNPKSINDDINYSVTFNSEEDTIFKALLIKSSKVDDKLLVEYFNFEGKLLFTNIVDYNNQNVIFELPNINSNVQNRNDGYPCGNSWGQNTADCLANVYSNHGWLSVWATVQTAFIPQTAAAFAVVCAVDAATSNQTNCDSGYTPIN